MMIKTYEDLIEETNRILKLQSEGFQISIDLAEQTRSNEAVIEIMRLATSKEIQFTSFSHV